MRKTSRENRRQSEQATDPTAAGVAGEIGARRTAMLRWVLNELGPKEDELRGPVGPDSRAWSLNHARLVLGEELEKANLWFETFELDPRPKVWGGTSSDTPDWDFPATNILRTVLDFADSPRLGARARNRLRAVFTGWEQPRKSQNQDNDRVHRYPAIHTENHDIMCLTIGLFGAVFAGRDPSGHLEQLTESLAMRFRRGWTEWHSPVYQLHYLHPLLILAEHAPDARLRRAAGALVNVQLAERAALSVGGYLGGAFQRGYDAQFASARHDTYLPVMWLAFGLPDRADGLRCAGTHFAASRFVPHPAVAVLATLPAHTPLAVHRGTRDCSRQQRELPRRTICYWNTPHISMGSMRIVGRAHQARFFNVLFGADPGMSVRTHLDDPEQTSPWEPRREKGAVVQHEDWLIAQGRLVEEGGVAARPAGDWRLYRVGRGLCAHAEPADGLHVFKVGDLDRCADEAAFLSGLSLPEIDGRRLRTRDTGGRELVVELDDMSLAIDGRPEHVWGDKLHAGPWLHADWDSGRIIVTADGIPVTFGMEGAIPSASDDSGV